MSFIWSEDLGYFLFWAAGCQLFQSQQLLTLLNPAHLQILGLAQVAHARGMPGSLKATELRQYGSPERCFTWLAQRPVGRFCSPGFCPFSHAWYLFAKGEAELFGSGICFKLNIKWGSKDSNVAQCRSPISNKLSCSFYSYIFLDSKKDIMRYALKNYNYWNALHNYISNRPEPIVFQRRLLIACYINVGMEKYYSERSGTFVWNSGKANSLTSL